MEQGIIEDLIIESIKIYGQDMWYIPRTMDSLDPLYTEDDASIYDSAHMVELYVKNVEGFQGDGDFLSKFGVEIRDRMTFTIARRTFLEEVGGAAVITRPREGDLIYFPLNNKIWQIKFVEHEAVFYQMGALQTWDLVCEIFEYSNERFNTGIPFVDDLMSPLSFDSTEQSLLEEDGSILLEEIGVPLTLETEALETDILDDNDFFQTQANNFIDFTEMDPFAEGRRY